MSSRKIYTVETHDQVLALWRQNKTKNARVLHIDFHCDMRGLMINRKTNMAFPIWDRYWRLDEGNFLKHAILEGVVKGVRWIHDEPGGRLHDVKTVKYQTDLSSLLHRLANLCCGVKGIPIKYEVMSPKEWAGIEKGEILDIDWDFFASFDYPRASISERVESFLARRFDHVPEQTFVCYSPGYSHPTRQEYQEFVARLAARFNAEVVEIPSPATATAFNLKSILRPIYRPLRQLYDSTCLALRSRGIY